MCMFLIRYHAFVGNNWQKWTFFRSLFFSCSLTINKRKQVNIAYFSQRSPIIHMAVITIVHKPYWIAEPIWRGKWFDTLLIALILALPQTQSFVKIFLHQIYLRFSDMLTVRLLTGGPSTRSQYFEFYYYFCFAVQCRWRNALYLCCSSQLVLLLLQLHLMHIPILSHDHTSMHLALTLIALLCCLS